MRDIARGEVIRQIQVANSWWNSSSHEATRAFGYRRRAYFQLFHPLVAGSNLRRAVLLLGPRRVGKTVLMHQVIQELIHSGVPAREICYLSVDHPLYNARSLDDLLGYAREASSGDGRPAKLSYVFFDEIQYLKDWELHLKALVDGHEDIRFVASGSAAAALRLKSQESGAGRFTDFLLPPLTFHEYLVLSDAAVRPVQMDSGEWHAEDIRGLNQQFLDYLNFGGYPEVALSREAQSDAARYVKSDIIDKVLLRDLPSLYGISDIQELNSLFTTLAYNTADEVSLEGLAKNSGVAKNTLRRYITYLEAAFLIRVVHRIDRSAKRFVRANHFKVYLTNPTMRSALFSPIVETDDAMGAMAETGILSQWFHANQPRYYARWDSGEVDIVALDHRQKPSWAVEVKWTDRFFDNPRDASSLPVLRFCESNALSRAVVTTLTRSGARKIGSTLVTFQPASLYCYILGFNIVAGKAREGSREPTDTPPYATSPL